MEKKKRSKLGKFFKRTSKGWSYAGQAFLICSLVICGFFAGKHIGEVETSVVCLRGLGEVKNSCMFKLGKLNGECSVKLELVKTELERCSNLLNLKKNHSE